MQKTKSSKALTAAIALALTVGITGAVNAANYDTFEQWEGTKEITDPDITITTDSDWAVGAGGNGVLTLGGDQTKTITISSTGSDGYVGVGAEEQGTVTVGTPATENITITASGNDGPIGIFATRGSGTNTNGPQITVNGKNLTINASTETTGNAFGIEVMNSTENATGDVSTVTINAENTIINAKSSAESPDEFGEYPDIGMAVYSNGRLNVNGNLEVNARTAISTRGNATVNINQDKNHTVKLNGNIDFDSGANRAHSGHNSNAALNLNLTNPDSYLHGNILQTGKPSTTDSTFTGTSTIEVSNGASWTADGVPTDGAGAVNFVNNLTVDNGTVDTGRTLSIYNSLNESNGATVRADNVLIGDNLYKNISTADPAWTTATANVGTGASLTAQNLSVNQNSAVNANDGGTVTASDTATVNGTVNVNNGGTVNADNLTVNSNGTVNVNNGGNLNAENLTAQSGSHLNSEAGGSITLNNATLNSGADVNLAGTTTVNNSLTNNADGTISNLVLGTPDVTVNGTGTTKVSNLSLDGNAAFTKDGTYRTLDGSGLDVTDAAVDVSNLHVTGADSSLRGGQTAQMTLLDNNTGHALGNVTGAANQPFTQGTTLQGTGRASVSGNDVIYTVNISNQAQPQTHSAVMAQDAGLTTIVNGFDYISRAAETMQDQGLNTFASFGGGENRYDTGSHIKTNDWHLAAGVGVKNTRENGSGTEYGVFFDYGDGRYRTFQNAGRGDGKAIYKGGGLFGKYTTPSQFYVEGSFRAGRVKNNADGIFHDALGRGYDFKTNTNYTAFHIGVGQIYTLNDKDNLDVYGKFFHTHLNSDSFDAGGHYDLDSVNSNLLRIGARWNHKQGSWTHYLGLAYEYEFDGEAKGTADGARIRSADIGGSSGRFELGTKVELGNWTIGANANAYVGKHRGVMGEVTASLKF